MYNKKIKASRSATHLDIVRNVNGKPDIEGKTNLGRKTACFRMGAGFLGGGGAQTIPKRVYMVNFCSTKATLCARVNIAS